VRALILSAGLGMRLRPLTHVRAKAAVPVNGRAIVQRVAEWLVGEGISDLVVNLHHRPASITAVLGDGGALGARVRYSWENPVLGSAGGPRHALPLVIDQKPEEAGSFLLINGDTLTDMRLDAIVETHRASGALVTLALTRNPRPDIYGGVVVERGYVSGFSRPNRTPHGEAFGTGAVRETFHFIGVQVAEPRAFIDLEDGVPAESVMQLYPRLMEQNPRSIAAHVVDARFQDIGTPTDYLETSRELAATEGNRLIDGERVSIDSSAELHDTAVWNDVTIQAGARLDECIVCDGVEIPAGSRYRRCAIVRGEGIVPGENERIDGQLLIKEF
jgi:mannose-1-phosphate guanylyltransferase / phosphomannomutase